MSEITVMSSGRRGVKLFIKADDWLNSQEIDYILDRKIQGQFQKYNMQKPTEITIKIFILTDQV